MNQAIRNVWIGVMVLFLAVMGALSYIQFFAAAELNANPLNNRQLYRDFDLARGAILVDGEPVAESVRSDGQFEHQRRYNTPLQYSHLTGFYSLAYGSTHLESAKNPELTGQSDSQFFTRLVNLVSGASNEGASVELTIDGELQQQVYDILPDGVQSTAIVSDPRTGDILAMVSKPGYDTNKLAVHSTSQASANMAELLETPGLSPYINPATGHLISPGSTFKILDVVAALESGEFDLDTVFENPASVQLPGTTAEISNFGEGICTQRPQAQLDFIMAQSCNTPFVEISRTVGEDALRDVTERFGFGQQIDFPTRVAPSVFPSELTAAQLAQSSIGQFDVKASPLQMNMVAMGIANDGVIMKPNLVRKVVAPDLRVLEETQPEEFSTATTPEVAEQVTELMRGPLDGGTAASAAIPGLDIAAKTGTAELGDGTDRVNSWITGFAPADDPQVAVTIVVEKIDYATGHTLTSPNLKKILEAVFNK
ncbi:peptidoglycan D,D-transpeptidase FtsI family protein [Zafaria sp. Z1313]|uniref:peptidoglycan D,D-transpeptidase FtsI family protein n=1 Tax=unclassified Zafaria TaxID=2828765 RepID=UPI002E77BE12|nr:penicillin-binding transpeptidase domain-containing protein [Zafaria sp. J156]MEE1621469.1 penicillin-binding transpeptidase domain-containing protein [Zafaria sp. J156]